MNWSETVLTVGAQGSGYDLKKAEIKLTNKRNVTKDCGQ